MPVDLRNYVDVKERIRLFLERYPDGRLVTEKVRVTDRPDGVPRVWVRAAAYRTPDDPLPGIGWSWMQLPGTTNFTRGSEIENTETSAWGRAIGATGIGIADGIATSDEIASKEGETRVAADVAHGDDGSLIGVVQVGDKQTSDYLVRNTPDGPALGFRLRGDRGGILVEAKGELAAQLHQFKDKIVGARVTVWGTVGDRSFKTDKRTTTYQALAADRISVPLLGLLPMEPDHDVDPKRFADAEPHPDNIPLFDADEDAAIAEALGVTK